MKVQTLQEWAAASRIFALAFTDIVDSTALANDLGDEEWIELLRKHFAQARLLMGKYDHHEIKIIGDSFMVIFRSALDALDFVLALETKTGDDRILIRAGIHVGSARIVGDDIFGNMVNYTKRVESVQTEGGITVSDGAKRDITNEKAQRHSGLTFQPLRVPFKGFPEQETVWLVISASAALRAFGKALLSKLPSQKL
jgi:class 3 adenylate cyclase